MYGHKPPNTTLKFPCPVMNQNLHSVGMENSNATFTSAMCHMLLVFAFVTTPPWVLTRFIHFDQYVKSTTTCQVINVVDGEIIRIRFGSQVPGGGHLGSAGLSAEFLSCHIGQVVKSN